MGISRKRKVLGEVNGNHRIEGVEAPPAKQHKINSQENKQIDAQNVFSHVFSSKSESSDSAVNPSAPQLDSVPNELLQMIFKKLPQHDQLSLSATSHRMAENFESTTNLKNFNFTLNFDTNYLPETNRNYSFVTMKDLATPHSKESRKSIASIMERIGEHIRKLELISGSVTKEFLVYILSFCPDVESISFDSFTITQSKLPEEQLYLPGLKYLKIDGGSSLEHMQQIFQNVDTIEELVFEARESDYDSDDDDEDEYERDVERAVRRARVAVEIMLRQRNLKKANICDAFMFESLDVGAVPFQLESIVLSIASTTSLQLQNLNKFVRSQNELKNVTLNVRTMNRARHLLKAFRYILRLQGLKSLSIVFYEESNMGVFYSDAISIKNPSVEDLYISVNSMKHAYKRFIETTATMFPNLKRLHLKLGEEWIEPDVSSRTFAPLNRLSNLVTLELEEFKTSFLRNLETQLTTFRVAELGSFNKADFESFLKKNQHLEDIAFRFASNSDEMQSAIHLIESAVLLLPRIKSLCLCTNASEISPDQRKNIKDAAAQCSSLKMLSICNDHLK